MKAMNAMKSWFKSAVALVAVAFGFAANAENVAKIGDTEYATLAAAVGAAKSGDTITMLAVSSGGALVAAGKAITIDLKGFVLNGQIEYKGDLTLTDSVGTGYIRNTSNSALTGTGNLVLEANIGASVARSMDGVYATNGKVTIATDIKIYVSGEGIHCNGADLTITGEPTVDVRKNYDGTALNIEGKSTVSIAGGTYWGDAFALWGDGEGQNVIVTGGKFKAYNTDNDSVCFWGSEGLTVAISGGIYSDDSAKEYLASGYEVVDNSDPETKDDYPYAVVRAAVPVARVVSADGKTTNVFMTIEEALAAWTSGTTLTLLDNVELSSPLQVNSNEKHILQIGTFTLSAPNGNAIEIINCNRTSAGTALEIYADANNPGTISAPNGACVTTTGKTGVQDRPITKFYGGNFFGQYVVQHSGSSGTSAPQFYYYAGTFNASSYTVYTNRALNWFFGGLFLKKMMMSVDQDAYTMIAGGRFVDIKNNFSSSLNTSKWFFGSNYSSKTTYDVDVTVDADGYYIVSKPIVAKPGSFKASLPAPTSSQNTLYYSNVKTEGRLYFATPEKAIEFATSGNDVILYEGVTTAQGKTIDSGNITVNASADGSCYDGNVTLTSKYAKFTAVGNFKGTVSTTVQGYVVKAATEGDTTVYSVVEPGFKIGDKGYATLDEAIKEATPEKPIEILKAGSYTWPASGIPQGVTLKGNVAGVEFACPKYSCPSGLTDVTLQNLVLNFGQDNYNGFTHCTNLTFDGCTLNGLSNTYNSQTYRNCTFNQSKVEYCQWVYGCHVVYEGCTFNTWGKALNVYAEGTPGGYTLLLKDCTFNNLEQPIKKPAILVKSLNGSTELEYDITIVNCKIAGNWPNEENPYEDGEVKTCGLWDVEEKGTKITVTLDGELVWINGAPPHWAAQIGTQKYDSLSNAVFMAQNGDTIVLLDNNAEQFAAEVTTLFTIDKNGFAFDAANITPKEGCELVENLDQTWSYRMKVEVKDQVTKNTVEIQAEPEDASAAVAITDDNFEQLFPESGAKTLEIIAEGVGTVSFDPTAVTKIGGNIDEVITAAGGKEESATAKTTLTVAITDITEEVKEEKPEVIVTEQGNLEVVQAISIEAIMQTIVKKATSETTTTNETVFSATKAAGISTVTIPYTGIAPQVWFVDTSLTPWTTNEIKSASYDTGKKELSFDLEHFSDYVITDAEVFAKVGSAKFRTLQEAFEFVATNQTLGTTVTLTKTNELTTAATLAEGVTATLDLAGKAIKGSIDNDGILTITGNGEIDAGAAAFVTGADTGKTYILDGTFKGAFPTPIPAATNAGPVLVSGGYFSQVIPWAYCAPGYEPDPTPTAKGYTVKNAKIYIRDISACQRYPWNGYVDITLDVCWDVENKAKLYVYAYEKESPSVTLPMTTVTLIEEGVSGTRDVNCVKGFDVVAPTRKTLHLIWNSVEGVPTGTRKEQVGFRFLAK